MLLRALLGFADSPAPRLHALAGEEEDRAPGPGPPGAAAGLVRARIAGLVSLPGPSPLDGHLLGELDMTCGVKAARAADQFGVLSISKPVWT